MRQIGVIPRNLDPRPLIDHLTVLGMPTRVDDRPEGWGIWIYNEDHVAKAREEFAAYLGDPADPRFQEVKKTAEAVRRESDRLDRAYRKNVRDLRGQWDHPNLKRRPLTSALLGLSVAVYLVFMTMRHEGWLLYERLLFSGFWIDELGREHSRGLLDIVQRGEVWRLVTPIFLHFSLLHIAFNSWALWVVGSVIEIRRGTRTLAVLVFLSAIASNVGEYAYELNRGEVHPFGGMSGVVYALFGYVWMKGLHEPEQGMILHPSSVRYMLLWLVLGFTGVLGPIANAAHLVGLIVGVLFGLARF